MAWYDQGASAECRECGFGEFDRTYYPNDCYCGAPLCDEHAEQHHASPIAAGCRNPTGEEWDQIREHGHVKRHTPKDEIGKTALTSTY